MLPHVLEYGMRRASYHSVTYMRHKKCRLHTSDMGGKVFDLTPETEGPRRSRHRPGSFDEGSSASWRTN